MIHNFCWAGDSPWMPAQRDSTASSIDMLPTLHGQFALALTSPEDTTVTLIRDRLGANKLFFALHESGTVLVANYLIDLARRGVPFECIYSVPAGHFMEIDLQHRALRLIPYFSPRIDDTEKGQLRAVVATTIRTHLDRWFKRLAEQFHSRRIFVCVSGGLDSGLIAAFAKRYFPDVTAYTFGYTQTGDESTEDAYYGRLLAEHLELPFRFVPASSDDVLKAVESALVYGQDWRDFNVHCAIVNELLARAMASDLGQATDGLPPLVLTGDLMNEFIADYTPVVYGGREYYPLPKLDRASLRLALIRGLDAGDREVGIFARHGLDLIQPYGLLLDLYLALPGSLLREGHAKQTLARAIAGDLLPDWIFHRTKVRAQIGNSKEPAGILPVLSESGRDAEWIQNTFRELLGIEHGASLSRFIRAGIYRFINDFPRRTTTNGYFIN